MSRDQSQNVVKTFDSNWRYELSKAQIRNARERTQHVYDIQQSTSATEKTPLLQTKLLPTKINVQKSTRRLKLDKAIKSQERTFSCQNFNG
ncbi:hypothetical protein AM593_10536, partial [Mytilus galloprovincialis]